MAEIPRSEIANSCEFLIGEPEDTTPQVHRGFRARYPINKKIVLIFAFICASIVISSIAFGVTIWNKEPPCLRRIVVFHNTSEVPSGNLHLATHVVFSEIEILLKGIMMFKQDRMIQEFWEMREKIGRNDRIVFMLSIGGSNYLNVSTTKNARNMLLETICLYSNYSQVEGVNLNFEMPKTELEKRSFMKILQHVSGCIGVQGGKKRLVSLNLRSLDDVNFENEDNEDPLRFHISNILRHVDFVNLENANEKTLKTRTYLQNSQKFNFQYSRSNPHQFCGTNGIWVPVESGISLNRKEYDHLCHRNDL